MKRSDSIKEIQTRTRPYDILVIGGGATGLGVAVDAASRGYDTLLLEQHDFAKGTSSRSTKLIHGGIRYLKQGNISLVLEALKERGRLCVNAPHLVHHQSFIVPIYTWWEGPFYGVGMKLYDRLAGELGLKPSKPLSREDTLRRLPTIEPEGLRRGVIYYDGQFDDARLAVSLMRTIQDHGGCAANYMQVTGLIKAEGMVQGALVRDTLGGAEFEVRARVVINATGVFTDSVRRMDVADAEPVVVASQGTHIVLPREFQPGDSAIMIPHTADGRVLFAVPWHDHVVVGTTDVGVSDTPLEPRPKEEEIEFLLTHSAKYLTRNPERSDVLSVFSGLRPLVKADGDASTAALSRDHTILISHGGLLSITGGKWTTYRKMAEDAVDQAETVAGFDARPCRTAALPIHGATDSVPHQPYLQVYGTDAPAVWASRPEPRRLHDRLPYLDAEVVWAVREEMACTVEDVLARRTRALFLDARAAMDMAQAVAGIMAAEIGWSEGETARQLAEFDRVARGYIL